MPGRWFESSRVDHSGLPGCVVSDKIRVARGPFLPSPRGGVRGGKRPSARAFGLLFFASLLLLPTLPRSALRNFNPLLSRKRFGSGATAFPAQRDGRRVLAVVRDGLNDLASRDPHDVDGVGDHISRAFLTFGALGHMLSDKHSMRSIHGG